jgi:phospholipase C
LPSYPGHSICKDSLSRINHVVVIYQENVTPPGQGGKRGPHDDFGPSTRIPALVISPFLHGSFVVDHTQHDTTSVLATIERRFGLDPLSTRDATVQDLSSVFWAGKPR